MTEVIVILFSCQVWSLAEGKLAHVLRGHSHVVSSLTLVRPVLVSGGWDSQVLVWHVKDGSLQHRLATCKAWISRVVYREGRVVAGG